MTQLPCVSGFWLVVMCRAMPSRTTTAIHSTQTIHTVQEAKSPVEDAWFCDLSLGTLLADKMSKQTSVEVRVFQNDSNFPNMKDQPVSPTGKSWMHDDDWFRDQQQHSTITINFCRFIYKKRGPRQKQKWLMQQPSRDKSVSHISFIWTQCPFHNVSNKYFTKAQVHIYMSSSIFNKYWSYCVEECKSFPWTLVNQNLLEQSQNSFFDVNS